MKKWVLGAILVAMPVTALQAMDVATFLRKADALQAKGPLALLSSDVQLLKGEIANAGKAARAEQNGARAAGRRPAFCMPQPASIKSSEILTHFRAVPPAQRAGTDVRTAFRTLMIRKYPCAG